MLPLPGAMLSPPRRGDFLSLCFARAICSLLAFYAAAIDFAAVIFFFFQMPRLRAAFAAVILRFLPRFCAFRFYFAISLLRHDASAAAIYFAFLLRFVISLRLYSPTYAATLRLMPFSTRRRPPDAATQFAAASPREYTSDASTCARRAAQVARSQRAAMLFARRC